MKRVVIVDDETIVRVTLRSLLDWEAYGFQVQADFNGGKPALEYFETHTADLLITDMKMPDMDGISLMKQLRGSGKLPITVVLSGYHEFELVRESFLVGAFDYLLKSDLTKDSLDKLLTKLNDKIFINHQGTGEYASDSMSHPFSHEKLDGEYGVVLFEIEDKQEQMRRFGEDLPEMLQKTVLELARQLPRVAARGRIEALDPFHYVLLYQTGDKQQYHHTILSVVRQLQSVWNDYMNLICTACVSEVTVGSGILEALQQNSRMMYGTVLKASPAICVEWLDGDLIRLTRQMEDRIKLLVSFLYEANEAGVNQEKKLFFGMLYGVDFTDAVDRCLALIILLARQFRVYRDDFKAIFPEEVDYFDKLKRLENIRELELWMNNYFSWIINHIEHRHDNRQADVILRAKRFLADNYANPELTLKNTADYIGLNEKYFSFRFTKETGITFSAYLMNIRLQRAKELMATTDLKMYEISEQIGYHNVEHFNRLFKRSFGESPREYRKKI
ncbi:MAG: response regulator transcription factor [Lachnospiraceae bacterium]